MARSKLLSLVLGSVFALAFAGCATDSNPGENTGSVNLNLELAEGIIINEVDWTISGGDMDPMSGTIDTSAPGATASVEVFGLPPGEGYLVELEASDESGEVTCRGDAEFDVEVGVATDVMVFLNCKRPTVLGGVRVNGKFNICAQLAKVVVSPLQTSVGNDIDLSAQGEDVEGDDISYVWTASGGTIADASAQETTYTCDAIGEQLITITVSDDGGVWLHPDGRFTDPEGEPVPAAPVVKVAPAEESISARTSSARTPTAAMAFAIPRPGFVSTNPSTRAALVKAAPGPARAGSVWTTAWASSAKTSNAM